MDVRPVRAGSSRSAEHCSVGWCGLGTIQHSGERKEGSGGGGQREASQIGNEAYYRGEMKWAKQSQRSEHSEGWVTVGCCPFTLNVCAICGFGPAWAPHLYASCLVAQSTMHSAIPGSALLCVRHTPRAHCEALACAPAALSLVTTFVKYWRGARPI